MLQNKHQGIIRDRGVSTPENKDTTMVQNKPIFMLVRTVDGETEFLCRERPGSDYKIWRKDRTFLRIYRTRFGAEKSKETAHPDGEVREVTPADLLQIPKQRDPWSIGR